MSTSSLRRTSAWLPRPHRLALLGHALIRAWLAGDINAFNETMTEIASVCQTALVRYFLPFCGNEAAAEIEALAVWDRVAPEFIERLQNGSFTFSTPAGFARFLFTLLFWRARKRVDSLAQQQPLGPPISMETKVSRRDGAMTLAETIADGSPSILDQLTGDLSPDEGEECRQASDEEMPEKWVPAPDQIPLDDPLSDGNVLRSLRWGCRPDPKENATGCPTRAQVSNEKLRRLIDGLDQYRAQTPPPLRRYCERAIFLMTRLEFDRTNKRARQRFDGLMRVLRRRLSPSQVYRARRSRKRGVGRPRRLARPRS